MSYHSYAVGADELPYADFRVGHYCDSCDQQCNEPASCHDFECEKESLCVGCAFSCADCGRDFCEDHVVRVWSVERPGWAHHFCRKCFAAEGLPCQS